MPLTLTYAQNIRTIIEDNILENLSNTTGKIQVESNNKKLPKIKNPIAPRNLQNTQILFENYELNAIFQKSNPIYYVDTINKNVPAAHTTTITTSGNNASLHFKLNIAKNQNTNQNTIKIHKNTNPQILHITLNTQAATNMIVLEIDIPKNQTLQIQLEQDKNTTSKTITPKTIKKENVLFLQLIIRAAAGSHIFLNNRLASKLKTKNQQFVYCRTSAILSGISSTYEEYSTINAQNQSYYDLKTTTELKSPHTTTNITLKGVVHDKSKCITQSNIIVRKEAEFSIGKEHSEILLIDEESKAETIPQLIVQTDNTSCTHTGSIASLNEEKIFYMTTKGIATKDAKELLINGFLQSN